ncbi:hypothetical protein BYT27DRAFT_7333125 [Phlegmacium glaucopus]|nr:hypothetical protein BYT27DRAFT_7333125 [Phlegmacium glaucopus]
MNTRKSLIASTVIDAIKKLFTTSEYEGQPAKIKGYAQRALRPDGAAYYTEPTPNECKATPGEPGYTKPKGLFQFEVIIAAVVEFPHHADKSKVKPNINPKNPPKGFLGLVLTTVERGFKAFASDGNFLKPKKFSHDNYWRQLDDFMGKVNELSEGRRKAILDKVSVTQNRHDSKYDSEDIHGDMSIMSDYRGQIFIER